MMANDISAFYNSNPELFGDDRSKAAIDRSLVGLQKILAILDKYEISALVASEQLTAK